VKIGQIRAYLTIRAVPALKMMPDWGREIDVDNRTGGGVKMEAGDVSRHAVNLDFPMR
jgi:hypothetical protein